MVNVPRWFSRHATICPLLRRRLVSFSPSLSHLSLICFSSSRLVVIFICVFFHLFIFCLVSPVSSSTFYQFVLSPWYTYDGRDIRSPFVHSRFLSSCSAWQMYRDKLHDSQEMQLMSAASVRVRYLYHGRLCLSLSNLVAHECASPMLPTVSFVLSVNNVV